MVPIEPPACRFVLPDPVGPDDLVALGGGLDTGTVLAGYRKGMFPMHLPDGTLGWWSPARRGIIPLDGLVVSRSLRRSLRRYTVTFDRACDRVIAGCADPNRPHGWIGPEIVACYGELRRLGWVHSVEVWDDAGDLVGGLYGVAVGGLFAGESMFHRAVDASKVALVHLVEIVKGFGMGLLDVQWVTDHLRTLGAVEISRVAYLARLGEALRTGPGWPDPVESGP